MPVEISDILHVLAHELRTPVGIAHGYVRLLLEDRLSQEVDRRRALEQMQKALGRLGALSNETTALASWYDAPREEREPVGARSIIDRVTTAPHDLPMIVDATQMSDDMLLRTSDASVLIDALVSVIRATARELRGETCAIVARPVQGRLEMLVGPSSQLQRLGTGPGAPDAGPMVLERGGLGLALVHAALVLDAHGAERWTMNSSRQIAGIRLPLEERPHL